MVETALKDRIVITFAMVLMVLPVVAVILNAFATNWSGTVLPEGYTLKWFSEVLGDPTFRASIWR